MQRFPSMQPSRRSSHALMAMLLVALAVFPSACSRINIDSTPLGGKDYRVDTGTTAERVNGWPLFYRMGENMSLFWPLFQKTPDGHAVWPAYEKQKDPKRFLAALGIAADLQLDKSDYRVANIRVNPEKDAFQLWPLLFLDWNPPLQALLVPLFYYEAARNNEDASIFLSLLFSRGEDFIGILGPAFIHSQDEDSRYTSVLWPFLQSSRKGTGEEAKHWTAAPFPFYMRWREPDLKRDVVFPLYFGEREGDDSLIVSPIFIRKKDDEGRYLAFLWPFFRDRIEGEGEDAARKTNLPWPLHWRWRGPDANGDALFPSFCKSQTGEKSLLATPAFVRTADSDSSFLNVLGPFLTQIKSPEKTTTITPLVSWGKNVEEETCFLNLGSVLYHYVWGNDDDYISYLTPLAGCLRWKGAKGNWLVPLYAASRKENGPKTFLSLPFSTVRKADGNGWTNLGVLLGGWHRDGERKGWYITPLIRAQADAHGASSSVFPLYDYARRDYPAEDGAEAATVTELDFLLLGDMEKTNDTLTGLSLFPLFDYQPNHFSSIPLSYHDDIPEQEEIDRLVADIRKGDEKATERDWHTFRKRWQFLWLINGRTHVAIKTTGDIEPRITNVSRLFPIFKRYRVEGETDESKLLWGLLWNSQKHWSDETGETVERVRRRFLWKVVDYERAGDVTTLDMFPFITRDRDPERDYASFSFFGPLLRRTRLAEQKEWRLFGLRLGDRIDISEDE